MSNRLKLYWHPLSGHAHRAQLFLALIDAPFDLIEVDLSKGAHKTPDFLKLNRFGQVPVLDDNGTIISDSNAILVYAAKKFGRTNWLPEDAKGAAIVQKWLSVAAGQIAYGPAAARLITVFGASFSADEVIKRAHAVLAIIDAELKTRDWIALPHATIADIALYSYIDRAPEGNVDLTPYANVRTWLGRIRALPGFVEFGRTRAGLEA